MESFYFTFGCGFICEVSNVWSSQAEIAERAFASASKNDAFGAVLL